MNKKWILAEKKSDDLEKQILFSRGWENGEEIDKFFHPDYERDLRDPFGLSGMKTAVDRIIKAIENNESVVVFGDYDADGVCSCVIFHDLFKKIGFQNFRVYLPDRYQEGYGLNAKAIEEFINQKVNLVITIDCGITDYDEIGLLKKEGVDVIVIDHHLASSELPPALEIIDPMKDGEEYPFKKFCGAGLAFKIVSALAKDSLFKIMPGWEKWLLDAVAIATIADMVPLVDENRALVFYGLEVLRKTRRPGLLALFKKTQIGRKNITEDDVGFSIAPCINVASRMDHAAASFSLLTVDSLEEAEWLSQKLVNKNQERKKIAEDLFKKIDAELAGREKLPDVIVLGDESWPVGVLAPLSNKVLEKYNRPVFLWGRGGITSEIKGSCRSGGDVNLVNLLREAGDNVFSELGGHAFAAGFTVKEGAAQNLAEKIEEAYGRIEHLKTEPPVLCFDAELNLEEIDRKLIEVVDKFRPFGVGNQKPIFLLSGVEVFSVKLFGNGGIHLQINFRKSNNSIIPAVGFFMKQKMEFPIEKGSKIDIAFSVEKSFYGGSPELRLRIVDIRPVDYIL